MKKIGSPPKILPWMQNSTKKLESELVKKYGESQRARLKQGLKQVKDFWLADDGNAEVFEEFVKTNFSGDQASLDVMFNRFENHFEKLYGHMTEIGIDFVRQLDLDLGPILPVDEIFAGYDASAHLSDDFFANKLAFTVLLNFPLTTLPQRLKDGGKWNRREWSEARLAQIFSKRVPADVKLAISEALAKATKYISEYNIWMHHLVDDKGKRLFPPKLRLLSHWNLRDELKSKYSGAKDGFAKQKMIEKVMERIITQTIPAVVINNPNVDWNPDTNEVKKTLVNDSDMLVKEGAKISGNPEPDTRYSTLLRNFNALKKVDPYSPKAPTFIARKFDEEREISEARVKAMLEQVLSSPVAGKTAKMIESRLGRKLEPFDIWYDGFKERGTYAESYLDDLVSKKYPTPEAYRNDIPNLLLKLGFSMDGAKYIADNIVVEPARGSGQAIGGGMRGEKAHLQTRIEKHGMNYKGFNIAVHEMGHTVEQTLSLNKVDHWFLQGVPNTAFTEAMAFLFQDRDLALLGLEPKDEKGAALKVINTFWNIFEISGVSLVDMEVWNWLYKHPKAKPAELKKATVDIAKRVWNRFFAPVIGKKDSILLGVYSHMISFPLYLSDYAVGYMIQFQIEEQMNKAGGVGPEFERMVSVGRIAPDLWMKNAVGSEVSPSALLAATEKALKACE